jgi:uncharacterized SAM-binding protein YcdF (DUF218 family)
MDFDMNWLTIKCISAFLLPPLNFLMLGVIGLALWRTRPRWSRTLLALMVALTWIFAMPVTGNALDMLLERDSAHALQFPVDAQAIVVLGGGVVFGSPEYESGTVGRDTLERLRYAARLQRQLQLPILVTGGDVEARGTSEGELMRDALVQDFRVPVRWVDDKSHDTIQNAAYSKRILDAAGVKTILLVTHGWHMARSRRLFEAAGFRVITAGTGFHVLDRLHVVDFLPSAGGLKDSQIFFHEVIGMLWSAVRRGPQG